MPTRPTSPDPSGASQADQNNPFASLGAGLGAGFDFFQDWLKAAGSALPNMPGAPGVNGGAGMPAWSMPTLDPAELEKRIQDLKTVQFWLEQNARMIAMTIQGLEVQRMTLSTLKGMNVSMDALRDSLKARNEAAASSPTPTPPPAPAPSRADPDASGSDDTTASATNAGTATPGSPESNELINPMRWWDTLTQQFTHLASQAAQSVNDSVGESMDMIKQAQAKAAEAVSTPTAPARKTGTTARKAGKPARKTTGRAPATSSTDAGAASSKPATRKTSRSNTPGN